MSRRVLPPWLTRAEGFVAASRGDNNRVEYDVEAVELGGVVWLDEVQEERLVWLWPGYVPRGKITILDGDPGLGKSTLSLDLVARRSRGDEMPYEEPPGAAAETSLIVSGEDDIADTIKPRLRAAGAEMSRVATLALRQDEQGRPLPFSVPEDMPRLKNAIGETQATFVVIDPITAFLSEHVQSHNDASVRKAMTPLTMLAQESGAAFLLLRHLNKDTSTTKALYRGGGSIGFTGSARSVLLAAEKPEGEGVMVLAQTKGNLARRGRALSLEWRLVSWDADPEIPRTKWLGESPLSADDLLRRPDARHDNHAQREAAAFLEAALADGPRSSQEVVTEARGIGITETTLKRARSRLNVHSFRERGKDGTTIGWFVHLPGQREPDRCDTCRKNLDPLGPSGG